MLVGLGVGLEVAQSRLHSKFKINMYTLSGKIFLNCLKYSTMALPMVVLQYYNEMHSKLFKLLWSFCIWWQLFSVRLQGTFIPSSHFSHQHHQHCRQHQLVQLRHSGRKSGKMFALRCQKWQGFVHIHIAQWNWSGHFTCKFEDLKC